MWENFWSRAWVTLVDNTEFLWNALQNTFIIAFAGFAIGLVLGTVIAVIKTNPNNGIVSKVAKSLAWVYILVLRGTPIVVQLLLLFFVFLGPAGIPALTVAVIVFGLNSGAHSAEILRGAIQGIDKGQFEAGRALGLSNVTTMRKVVLPQAYKNAVPALGNEMISLIKATSVVGFITVIDITRGMQLIVARTFDVIVPYMLLAFIYLTVVYLLTVAIKVIERRVFKIVPN
ncbi:MAG: amino acid ABC transporter permease [Firmicutes bacterium]|nr:amino acid ABC transporter permease [Bacillota bacterium]